MAEQGSAKTYFLFLIYNKFMYQYRIAIVIQGNTVPSSRFRILQYIPLLESAGIQCDVYAPKFSPSGFSSKIFPWRFYQLVKHISQLFCYLPFRFAQLFTIVKKKYDAIFLQKPLMDWPYLPILENFLYKNGQKIIFDLDDALYSKSYIQKKYINSIIELSSYVIVGNKNIFSSLLNVKNNISIIPTTVDGSRYTQLNKRKDGKICIGWTGTSSNLKYLIGIASALEKLSSNPRVKIRVICDVINVPRLNHIPNIDFCRWSIKQEIEQLSEFDIGLMPLAEDSWAIGKCGFKLIQYMAMGIPSVCSPVGANSMIIKDGFTGYHANTEQEWLDRLELLIQDECLRLKMGKNALFDYRNRFSVEVNTNKIANVIKYVCSDYKKTAILLNC